MELEPRVKDYFAGGGRKLVSVTPNDDYTLLLHFDNGEKRMYDVKPLDGVFAFLKPMDALKRVYIDDCGCIAWDKDPKIDSSVVWSNKIDLCPDSCYLDSVEVK